MVRMMTVILPHLEEVSVLPIRFYAVAAIALAPILDHFAVLPRWQAWLILAFGVGFIAFRLGVVLDDWLHRQEHRPTRRPSPRRVARVRRTGRALITR
jgi:hypothetical protein